MNRVATKYRVWSVFMFIYGSLCILGTLLNIVNLLTYIKNWCTTYDYGDWYSSYIFGVVLGYSIMFVIYFFASFMNIHGGILLRRQSIKRRGVYIFYAVMSILGALGIFSLLFINLSMRPYYSFLVWLVYAVLFMPGCILTAVMMLSKISQKEPVRQPNTNTREGTIRFLSGEYVESDIKLIPGQRLMLGSDVTQVNLVLHSAKISPYHVVIEYEGDTGCFLVTDFSATGTCVNGERLNIGVPCRVNPNSYVVLADGEIQMLII